MAPKKVHPKVVRRALSEEEKHLAMGKAIYEALEDRGALGMALVQQRNDKLVIAKIVTAVHRTLSEIEEVERKPGDQWIGTNIQSKSSPAPRSSGGAHTCSQQHPIGSTS